MVEKRHRITPVLLGLSSAVTVFDEEEIVAGDIVKIELEPEVFKMMHEAGGLWIDAMTKVIICNKLMYTFRYKGCYKRGGRIILKHSQ